jgi:hypothetical protein
VCVKERERERERESARIPEREYAKERARGARMRENNSVTEAEFQSWRELEREGRKSVEF